MNELVDMGTIVVWQECLSNRAVCWRLVSEKRCDHEVTAFIGGLFTHEFIAELTVRVLSPVGGSLPRAPYKGRPDTCLLPSSLCFTATTMSAVSLHFSPFIVCIVPPDYKLSNVAMSPHINTSDAVSKNKSFHPSSGFLSYFVTVMKSEEQID